METGSSGFDAYFLALARTSKALLITDDEPMSIHAARLGIPVILLRSVTRETITKQLAL